MRLGSPRGWMDGWMKWMDERILLEGSKHNEFFFHVITCKRFIFYFLFKLFFSISNGQDPTHHAKKQFQALT